MNAQDYGTLQACAAERLLGSINIDHVTRIVPGLDPREPATVRFAAGRSLVIPAAEGRRLVAQLNRCCVKRKE